MVLVIGLGVMFSTFLSGPVALMATLGAVVAASSATSSPSWPRARSLGGGPLESLDRILTQQNMISELSRGCAPTRGKDARLGARRSRLAVISRRCCPISDRFNFADHVSYGFDISGSLLAADALSGRLAFLLPVFVAGYLFLKTREVAE